MSWRNRNAVWGHVFSEMMLLSQMPTGWNVREDGQSQTSVPVSAGLPDWMDVAQTFEVEFSDWAKRCLCYSMLGDRSDRYRKGLLQSMVNSAISLFRSGLVINNGYNWYLGVGHQGGDAFEQDDLQLNYTSGNPETNYGWIILNNAYNAAKELKKNNFETWFTQDSINYWRSAHDVLDKVHELYHAAVESWHNHLHAAIGYIGEVQYNFEMSSLQDS
jgi:hypothetical protein